MKKIKIFYLPFVFWISFLSAPLLAQDTDTLKKYQEPELPVKTKELFYKSKAVRATIVPVILIGYGLSTMGDNGLYSNHEARRDILRKYPNFDTWLGDPFLVAPYVELAVANLFNIKSSHDFLNTTLLIYRPKLYLA